MAGSRNQSFDDRNTLLHYQGNWFKQNTFNATNTGQTGTLTTSNDLNASVTFTFPSEAIAFYFYGIRKAFTQFAICIDCDPKAPQFEIVDAANKTDDGRNPPVILYSHRFDLPGIHEVILRNERDPSIPMSHWQITVDRFEIEVPADVPHTREVPIGAIVGGTVGGVVGILVLSTIVFCFWWRKKTRRRISGHIVGRIFDPSLSTHEPPKPTPMTQTQSTVAAAGGKPRAPENTRLQALSSPSSVSHITSSLRETPQRDVDVGPAYDNGHNNVHDQLLPPDYEHVFESGRGPTRVTGGNRQRGKR